LIGFCLVVSGLGHGLGLAFFGLGLGLGLELCGLVNITATVLSRKLHTTKQIINRVNS